MSEELVDPEGWLNHEIKEIVSRIESLSLTPTPRAPLVKDPGEFSYNIDGVCLGFL